MEKGIEGRRGTISKVGKKRVKEEGRSVLSARRFRNRASQGSLDFISCRRKKESASRWCRAQSSAGLRVIVICRHWRVCEGTRGGKNRAGWAWQSWLEGAAGGGLRALEPHTPCHGLAAQAVATLPQVPVSASKNGRTLGVLSLRPSHDPRLPHTACGPSRCSARYLCTAGSYYVAQSTYGCGPASLVGPHGPFSIPSCTKLQALGRSPFFFFIGVSL